MRERHDGRIHHLERELEHELEHTLHALQHHHRKDCDVTLETPPTAAAPPIDAPTPDPATGAVPGDPAAGQAASSPAPTTYSINISGSVDDPTAEHNLFEALAAVVNEPAFGVTAATGSFQFAGQVDILNPTPPPATVSDLLDELTTDAAALDPSDAGAAKVQADVQALADALAAQSAEPSEQPSPSSDEPAPDAPVVDHTGTAVAL